VGVNSLRQAIINANTNPGPDTITFNIVDPFIKTITPATPLPALTDNGTTIDGYTQSGASPATAGSPAVLRIRINGESAAASVGLAITSSGNTIKGLIINNFDLHGIAITGVGATGNMISGNHIGTDFTGDADLGNGGNGIYIASGATGNVIGGSGPADRNIISGNNQSGILITGTGTDTNTVSGNYIGINAAGSAALPNTLDGIRITGGAQHNRVGGASAGERNIISGNLAYGIWLEGAETNSNLIQGNYIGLSSQGFGGIGNQLLGIYLSGGANHNVIGGPTTGERNIISANIGYGIVLNGASSNFISGNYIGTSPDGGSARGNNLGIYLLEASSGNVVGGDSPGLGNVISGNTSGIALIADTNTIRGNIIGLAADGITPLPNQNGITVMGSHNTIGGTLPAHRNIISGNLGRGLEISGLAVDASNNVISGNYIGTDSSGRIAVGNQVGLFLGPRAANNLIGGDTTDSANVISGNQFVGIWLEGGPDICRFYTIKGNYIGTDYLGLNPLGNLDDGIYFGQVAQSNFVGPDNIIAFNGGDGVQVDTPTATGNLITRNRIFTNGGLGIRLSNGGNSSIPAPDIHTTTFGSISSIRIAVSACGGCAVQVFNSRFPDGEGEFYLGGGPADAAGAYTLLVDGLAYPFLTATATDVRGTSEFSPVFTSTAYLLRLPMILR
jgi:titin